MRYIYFFGFLIGIIVVLIVATNIEQNNVLLADTFTVDGKTWRLSPDDKPAVPFLTDVPLDSPGGFAGDIILQKITIDPSNRLILKKSRQFLPASARHRLVEGDRNQQANIEEQTFSITLQTDTTDTLLTYETYMSEAPSGMAATEFGLYDWNIIGDKFYYVYTIENMLHTVRLKKTGVTYEKERESSMPYDVNNRGEPYFFESSTHEAILQLGDKSYMENTDGAFTVPVAKSADELSKAYLDKQDRNRKESEAEEKR
jgi:hypothetical protein